MCPALSCCRHAFNVSLCSYHAFLVDNKLFQFNFNSSLCTSNSCLFVCHVQVCDRWHRWTSLGGFCVIIRPTIWRNRVCKETAFRIRPCVAVRIQLCLGIILIYCKLFISIFSDCKAVFVVIMFSICPLAWQRVTAGMLTLTITFCTRKLQWDEWTKITKWYDQVDNEQ